MAIKSTGSKHCLWRITNAKAPFYLLGSIHILRAQDYPLSPVIDQAIQQKFAERNVMYVRNYEPGMDLSWQTVFQTSDKREVERYCTQMGQACSYKVGHTAWTRARAQAQKALGPKFALKQFHEVLREGAMPLSILERRIRERTAAIA